MAQTVSIILNSADRDRLDQIVGDRNCPLKHVQRAKIVLLSGDRLPVLEVARRAGVSRPAVWRWQQRFAEEGVDGLLRDKTRKPGTPPLPTPVVSRIVALTCSEPPGAVTHWTGRAMAKAFGISLRSIQRTWEIHRLQPHRPRTFKRSNDPAFAAKVEDIVASTWSRQLMPSSSRSTERARSRPSTELNPVPLKPGKCGTMTHDYKRNGTTTRVAALDVLHGIVVGRCMPKHRHQEFIKFLNAVERVVPAGKIVNAILDNYATHKHPKVLEWLADHPRRVFHFTPTSGSWLNAVENFFSVLTRKAIRRRAFTSVADLQDTIRVYIRKQNSDPKPFVWTKPAETILAKLRRLPEPAD
ncbi:IS630 family transposase ISAzba6 [Pleomorphomonas sp. T1.2MG-36]|uniref:IS630 family transposase n=1 Tax=Pleomorphomonas sp. T1.2MG-36 TaxID=3041167 RepID=UPI00247740C5|nr:IS630 family transposase [Pleomorphomonas sp. T1.2MG-36]CAI9404785.1 IS630 family transposase ISAzba6 [Pleomorphomonas sp. T1.2MG-36]CAI9404794.1 IS630 family transposase ISAzba6 [Pleomorphomonas sp. T1.2MG-36]